VLPVDVLSDHPSLAGRGRKKTMTPRRLVADAAAGAMVAATEPREPTAVTARASACCPYEQPAELIRTRRKHDA
jgi:hypothetical protein